MTPVGSADAAASSPAVTGPTVSGAFGAVAPARVLDTRNGTGAPTHTVAANSSIAFTVTGAHGIPATGVSAVVLNLTATGPTATGWITGWADGTTEPIASNVNFTTGQTVPNLAVLPVGADGKVRLSNHSNGTINLIADITGYYLAGTPTLPGAFGAVAPARVLDTRNGTGAPTHTVAANSSIAFTVTGAHGIPATGVSAVVLNLTATGPTATGWITGWADGTTEPIASNVNFTTGQTVPNLAVLPVGADGKVRLSNHSNGTINLIADITGYYLAGTPTLPGAFGAVAPARVLDTRNGTGAPTHTVAANSSIAFTVTGAHGIPATGVSAVVLNLTATGPTATGWITGWADGTTEPIASNVNFTTGQTVPNLAVLPVGADGKVRLSNHSNGTINLIADITGYYLAARDSAPLQCLSDGTNGTAIDNSGRVDVLDTLAQVQPAHPQSGASGATVCSARNSVAAFQVEVTAATRTPLFDVSMKSSDLTGPSGLLPAAQVRFAREDYVPITTKTDGELADVLPADAAGRCQGDCRFPDPLIPDVDSLFGQTRAAFPFTIDPGEDRVVWVDVVIPADTDAGTYRGTISITQSGGEPASIPVAVGVVDAVLPSTSTSDSIFFLSRGHIPAGSTYAEYAELGLDDRINVLTNAPLGAGDLVNTLKPLLQGTDPRVEMKGAQITTVAIQPSWPSTDVSNYHSFLSSIGQTSKARAYCDEVTPASCSSEYGSQFNTTWPNLPLVAVDDPEAGWPDPKNAVIPDALQSIPTTPTPLVNFLDPVAGNLPYAAGDRSSYLATWRAAAAGRHVWAYTSCESGGCGDTFDGGATWSGWPSYGIDQVASEQLAMGWQMFALGLDGELYYDTTSDASIWSQPMNSGVNGDGTLFYPYDEQRVGGSQPIPLESIRLKRIRQGRQDEELLKLAAANGSDAMGLARQTFTGIDASGISGSTYDVAEANLMAMFGSTPIGRHDLNCDGHNDFLAVQSGSGDLLFYPRGATDWFPDVPERAGTGFGTAYKRLLLAGDLNGDGAPDVVGQKADNSLWLLPGNCSGHFSATGTSVIGGVATPIGVGDFDGDGLADLIDQHADGTVWLLSGDGHGGLEAEREVASIPSGYELVGVGDLDGDGFADLVGRRTDGSLLFFAGDGTGGLRDDRGTPMALHLPTASDPQLIGAGDLSGDGIPDLSVIDSAGHLLRYAGNVSGTFATAGTVIGNGWNQTNLSLVGS